MGAIVSGEALPQLADLSVRCVTLPLMASVWSGGRWGWALGLFLIWHFIVFVPSLGLSDLNAAGPFAHFDDTHAKLIGYYVIWPSIAVGFALLGAGLSFLLALPRHLFPFGHLFSLGRGLTDTSRITLGYAITMAVAAFLVVMGSWVPYEFLVAFIGGGPPNIWTPIAGAAAPTVATLIACLFVFGLCTGKKRSDAHVFQHTKGAGRTVLKLAFVAVMGSLTTVLVAYFERDFDLTWMSALAVFAGTFLLSVAYYVREGRTERKHEDAETRNEHASDEALLSSK
jgi:hypothetical protein